MDMDPVLGGRGGRNNVDWYVWLSSTGRTYDCWEGGSLLIAAVSYCECDASSSNTVEVSLRTDRDGVGGIGSRFWSRRLRRVGGTPSPSGSMVDNSKKECQGKRLCESNHQR